jgi:nitric oxide reductase NorD protein
VPAASLSAGELEERLDQILWAALSSRRTAAGAARGLARLGRDRQELVLHWASVIEKSNSECAYLFASHAPAAFALLDAAGVESWVIHAMDLYDRSGLYAAVQAFAQVERFAERIRSREAGVWLEDETRVLEGLMRALSGRPLRLTAAADTFTDTEVLYLPEVEARLPRREDNFRLYKATAVYLWAQTRFGTWRVMLSEALARYPDRERALAWLGRLEGVRLGARVAQELPGAHRDMQALAAALDGAEEPAALASCRARLSAPSASVLDSLEVLARVYAERAPSPRPCCYQGRLLPERVEEVVRRRLEREKESFRIALARIRAEAGGRPQAREEAREGDGFGVRRVPGETTEGYRFEMLLDGQPLAPPEEVRGLMESIIQDLGEIPPDYLVPAGDGAYRPRPGSADPAADVWKGTYHEHGAHLYNEWDFRRQHYRKDWCVLRELEVAAGEVDFVERTLAKYARQLGSLRRTFEALRGEDRWLRREPMGDEVDLDALVLAYAEARRGHELSERLFARRHKVERSMAVMFMVDMSGSTRGWVNEAEREALVLLCEALEQLGDRYAIYGFSGMTRKRCEVYRIKRFEDRYDREVRARIAGIYPRDYTRMGVAIRHLTRLLSAVEARTRLLVTLSDGKPDDYGADYRGEYGIEDTRRALLEARREGVHPFCITIDREGPEYLPHMYGPVSYTVIDRVERLPLRVSEIYRRLTS